MRFRDFLQLEDYSRTGAKLGLYPTISDALGQYPPLYATPHSADVITYMDIEFGKKGPPGKKGIIWYKDLRKPH